MPQVSSELGFADRLGAWKARWGIGRMSYLVPPGLYAIGDPGADDPVVVTANYKMSYDLVRRALAGRRVWLLVLETHGINVWCAAGKGTFGTVELVQRIWQTGLHQVVQHRLLLLPILGAPGVAAHVIKQGTGFGVRYATIRATDLPEFLDNGMVTTPAMRELTFTLRERLVLVPVELVSSLPATLAIVAVLVAAGLLAGSPLAPAAAYLGGVAAGAAVTPLLLPWLPTRSFAVKGVAAGMAWSLLWYLLAGGSGWDRTTAVAAFLCLPAVSSFYALNFTGSTPFTSRSGVKKEMRRSLPAMGLAVLAGIIVWLAGRFV
ncbi:acetyl-CoA synthase subunit gamma [Geobacter pickeringii]|uniref:Acetyl-CoA synthase subunit gamma n=1 Tax=Geobacter pickeringii TaxID=345632 RepID=A0A0B5BI21_9BACT|nr:acetyl-CoA synthase subunit gamma [Geobacter pickeringii]